MFLSLFDFSNNRYVILVLVPFVFEKKKCETKQNVQRNVSYRDGMNTIKGKKQNDVKSTEEERNNKRKQMQKISKGKHSSEFFFFQLQNKVGFRRGGTTTSSWTCLPTGG